MVVFRLFVAVLLLAAAVETSGFLNQGMSRRGRYTYLDRVRRRHTMTSERFGSTRGITMRFRDIFLAKTLQSRTHTRLLCSSDNGADRGVDRGDRGVDRGGGEVVDGGVDVVEVDEELWVLPNSPVGVVEVGAFLQAWAEEAVERGDAVR